MKQKEKCRNVLIHTQPLFHKMPRMYNGKVKPFTLPLVYSTDSAGENLYPHTEEIKILSNIILSNKFRKD